MKRCSILGFGLACVCTLGVSTVFAQDLGGALKGAAGGGLDPSSLASGSAGNAAGIIEFCVKNNYLGGDAASSIKNALVGKLGGEEQAKADPGYTDARLTKNDQRNIELIKSVEEELGGPITDDEQQKSLQDPNFDGA